MEFASLIPETDTFDIFSICRSTTTGANNGAANPFQTIQRQDVGLKLKVKSQINEGNTVKLQIEQEVSSITPSSIATADIVTNKRTIKTKMATWSSWGDS